MAPKIETPKPPENLSLRAKKFWKTVLEDFALDAHHLHLLQMACEQLDRATAARESIDKLGVTVKDRWDQVKPNPAVAIEQVAHVTFARLLRELGLDIEPPQETRGPRRPFTRS